MDGNAYWPLSESEVEPGGDSKMMGMSVDMKTDAAGCGHTGRQGPRASKATFLALSRDRLRVDRELIGSWQLSIQ